MFGVSRRVSIFLAAALVLAVAMAAWLTLGADPRPYGDDPDLAEIERLRRAGNIDALARKAAHRSAGVASKAVEALGRLGADAVEPIKAALADPRPAVRREAAVALARTGQYAEAAPVAALARQDASADVRAAAVSSLDRLTAFEEMESLLAALDDPDISVRRRAGAAVVRITGVDVRYRPTDSPAKRAAAILEMRAVWSEQQARIQRFWTAVRKRDADREK